MPGLIPCFCLLYANKICTTGGDGLFMYLSTGTACAGGEWADGEGGLGAGHQDPYWDAANGIWQWPLCLHTVRIWVSNIASHMCILV